MLSHSAFNLRHSAFSSSPHSAFGIRHSAFSSSSHSAFGNRHSAFTFIEVLFAVILLGIGFIMIAAVFPVAIQQTSAVSDETQGSAIARDAIKKIQAVADAQIVGYPPPAAGTTNSVFQPTLNGATPVIEAFSPNIMQALGSDSFFSADGRFGWAGFYRRDSPTSPFAEVFIIALENPNFPNYTSPYVPGSPQTTLITGASASQAMVPPWSAVPPPIPPNLYNQGPSTPPTVAPTQPTPGIQASGVTTAILYYDATSGNSSVTFTSSTLPTPPNAVTGAYLLIADDANGGKLNGRFVRLGNQIATPAAVLTANPSNLGSSFALQPGQDFISDVLVPPSPAPAVNPMSSVKFFLIGAAPVLNSPTPLYQNDFTGPFSGPNQDIGVATGFIRVNTANN